MSCIDLTFRTKHGGTFLARHQPGSICPGAFPNFQGGKMEAPQRLRGSEIDQVVWPKMADSLDVMENIQSNQSMNS